MILSISISRDATNCEIGSNIVKNAMNVTNVKNVKNVRNAPGEKAGERVKKDERLGALALSLSARWRLPTLPLSQYHRRDKV